MLGVLYGEDCSDLGGRSQFAVQIARVRRRFEKVNKFTFYSPPRTCEPLTGFTFPPLNYAL